MHRTLKNWEAKRSGASLSIAGEDADSGQPRKLTDIATIEPINGAVIATGRDGQMHTLLVG